MTKPDLTATDSILLRRLSHHHCFLRLSELADDSELTLTEDEILTRLELLAERGFVRLQISAMATPAGSAILPPRVHHHRELAA